MDQPKRIILHNTSRNGYYWRIYDERGKSHYYKYLRGQNKTIPVEKLRVSEIKRIQRIAEKELKKEQPLEPENRYLDGVTIHFRINYNVGSFNEVKTELKDTFVEISDTKGKSDTELIDEAKETLGEFWASEVGFSQAKNIIEGINDQTLVVGLERGGSSDNIQIRTKYGTYKTTQRVLQSRLIDFNESKEIEKEFIKKYRGTK